MSAPDLKLIHGGREDEEYDKEFNRPIWTGVRIAGIVVLVIAAIALFLP